MICTWMQNDYWFHSNKSAFHELSHNQRIISLQIIENVTGYVTGIGLIRHNECSCHIFGRLSDNLRAGRRIRYREAECWLGTCA